MTANEPVRTTVNRSRRAAGLLLAALLLPVAPAQEFVFVSDRNLRNDGRMIDGYFYTQPELYMYKDGSEIRLTRTPDRYEADPAPSPDGRLIAHAWREVADPPEEASTWQWHLAVIDTLLGKEQAGWTLPHSQDLTRPADGFRMEWLADGSGFLALVPRADGGWEVRRFDLGGAEGERVLVGAEGERVMTGYGPFLSPNQRYLAVERNGRPRVRALTGGEEAVLPPGTVLGWYDDEHLFVAADGGLGLVGVSRGEWRRVVDYDGFYHGLSVSPDRQRYAFLLLQNQRWYVVFLDREHRYLTDFSIPGAAHGIDWIAPDKVLVNFETEEGDLAIASVDLEGNYPFLVDSFGHDYGGRALRSARR